MKLYGVLFFLTVFLAHESRAATPPPATTKWPEICRVMSLYRTCDDTTFRIACASQCSDVAGGCAARGLTYIPSKGTCYGITQSGENLWPFAMSSCLAYGTKLAVLKDASDAEVFTYINGIVGGTQNRFLVGAVSIGRDDIWVNVDGTEVDDNYWISSKPTSSNFLCMYSEKSNSFRKTSDSCGTNRGFICAGY